MTKQLMAAFCCICMCLCAPFCANGQWHEALIFYEEGQWAQARLAFERVYFASESEEQRQGALLYKAWCHKQEKHYAEGASTLGRANVFGSSDSLAFLLRYEATLLHFLAGEYAEAHHYWQMLAHFSENNGRFDDARYLEVLILNSLQRWEEGKEALVAYNKRFGLDMPVDSLYAFLEKPRLRNPERAMNLSVYLPGVGQWYAGFPGRAIISMALMGAGLAFGGYHVWQGYYLIGTFTGLSVYYGFYTGGIQHAGYLAERRNQRLEARYNAPIYRAVLEAEKYRQHIEQPKVIKRD